MNERTNSYKRYQVDYDTHRESWGVLDLYPNNTDRPFVAHTGSRQGARVVARRMNASTRSS